MARRSRKHRRHLGQVETSSAAAAPFWKRPEVLVVGGVVGAYVIYKLFAADKTTRIIKDVTAAKRIADADSAGVLDMPSVPLAPSGPAVLPPSSVSVDPWGRRQPAPSGREAIVAAGKQGSAAPRKYFPTTYDSNPPTTTAKPALTPVRSYASSGSSAYSSYRPSTGVTAGYRRETPTMFTDYAADGPSASPAMPVITTSTSDYSGGMSV